MTKQGADKPKTRESTQTGSRSRTNGKRRVRRKAVKNHTMKQLSHLCDVCGKSYETSIGLIQHTKIHGEPGIGQHDSDDTQTQQLACEHCHIIFNSKQCLKQHQNDAKKKSTTFCRQCDLHFQCKGLLTIHNETHSKHCCQMCDKEFPTSTGVRVHMKSHDKVRGHVEAPTPVGQKQFPCRQCKETFACKKSLRKHHQTKHKPYVLCELCGENYKTNRALQVHMKTHNGNQEQTKLFKCEECPKDFRTRSCLRLHGINHHGAKSSFTCQRCSKHFLNKSRLSEHVRISHTGEKIFICSRCGKGFTCSRNLKRHLLEPNCTPQGEKYQCKECRKTCKSKYSLLYHVTTYHGNKPFRCKFCDKKYATKEFCEKHENSHNGVYGVIPKKKVVKRVSLDFGCETCGKAYGNKHLLARHSLLHTGEKPHMCPICSKSFRCKSTLTEHERIHSGEKPFICKHCQTAFRLSGHLRYHLKALHKVQDVGRLKKTKRLKGSLERDSPQDTCNGNEMGDGNDQDGNLQQDICDEDEVSDSTVAGHSKDDVKKDASKFDVNMDKNTMVQGSLEFSVGSDKLEHLQPSLASSVVGMSSDVNMNKSTKVQRTLGASSDKLEHLQPYKVSSVVEMSSDVNMNKSTKVQRTLGASSDKLEHLQPYKVPSVVEMSSDVNMDKSAKAHGEHEASCDKLMNLQPSISPSVVNVADGGRVGERSDVSLMESRRTEELLNMLMRGSWLPGHDHQEEGIREDVFRNNDQFAQNITQLGMGFDCRSNMHTKSYSYQDQLSERPPYLFGSLQCQPFAGSQSMQPAVYDPQHVKVNPCAYVTNQKKASFDFSDIPTMSLSYQLQQEHNELNGIPPIHKHIVPYETHAGNNSIVRANQKEASFELGGIPPIEFMTSNEGHSTEVHSSDTCTESYKAAPTSCSQDRHSELPVTPNKNINKDNVEVYQPQYKELKTRSAQQNETFNCKDDDDSVTEQYHGVPISEPEVRSVKYNPVQNYEMDNAALQKSQIQTTPFRRSNSQDSKLLLSGNELFDRNDDSNHRTQPEGIVNYDDTAVSSKNKAKPQVNTMHTQYTDEVTEGGIGGISAQSQKNSDNKHSSGKIISISTNTTRRTKDPKRCAIEKDVTETTSKIRSNNGCETVAILSSDIEKNVVSLSKSIEDQSEMSIIRYASFINTEKNKVSDTSIPSVLEDNTKATVVSCTSVTNNYLPIDVISEVLDSNETLAAAPYLKKNSLRDDEQILKELNKECCETLAAIDEVIEKETKSYNEPIKPFNHFGSGVAEFHIANDLARTSLSDEQISCELSIPVVGIDSIEETVRSENCKILDLDQQTPRKEVDVTLCGSDVDSVTSISTLDLEVRVESCIGTRLTANGDVQHMKACQKVDNQSGINVTDSKHLSTKELKYLCEICGESYQTKAILRHHKKSHSSKLYNCATCHQTFTSWNAMRLHNINRHNATPPLRCATCGKGFLHVAKLEEHTRIQHTREMPFSCSKCSKTFICRRNLKRHLNEPLCVPSKERIPCDQCSKTCKTQYSLTYHKSLHHTQRPYHCEMCGKGYATKENCTRHENNHGELPASSKTPKPTSKDHVCKICHKAYSNKHFLSRHNQTHTGIKPFQCNICSKSFLYKSALKEHARTHTGERPYMCQHCGLSFRLSGHLRYHIKAVHDGDKPFACGICGKRFIFQSTMLHHMKTHIEGGTDKCLKVSGKKSMKRQRKPCTNIRRTGSPKVGCSKQAEVCELKLTPVNLVIADDNVMPVPAGPTRPLIPVEKQNRCLSEGLPTVITTEVHNNMVSLKEMQNIDDETSPVISKNLANQDPASMESEKIPLPIEVNSLDHTIGFQTALLGLEKTYTQLNYSTISSNVLTTCKEPLLGGLDNTVVGQIATQDHRKDHHVPLPSSTLLQIASPHKPSLLPSGMLPIATPCKPSSSLPSGTLLPIASSHKPSSSLPSDVLLPIASSHKPNSALPSSTLLPIFSSHSESLLASSTLLPIASSHTSSSLLAALAAHAGSLREPVQLSHHAVSKNTINPTGSSIYTPLSRNHHGHIDSAPHTSTANIGISSIGSHHPSNLTSGGAMHHH